MNELIITKNLCKSYANEGVLLHVLRNISMTIYEGQFTVIMGPSGSGKSTLLYALSGMDHITSGEVSVMGTRIHALNDKQLCKVRQEMFGFLFQQIHLVPNLTFLENICMPGYLDKKRKPREVQAHARELMAQVGIGGLERRLVSQTSGGQQQRCAMARALINRPDILFADEPTGSLNSAAGQEILNLMTSMCQRGQSIVMVTHDVRAALRADRILYLKDGEIIGELALSSYDQQKEGSRETQVLSWLSEMGW